MCTLAKWSSSFSLVRLFSAGACLYSSNRSLDSITLVHDRCTSGLRPSSMFVRLDIATADIYGHQCSHVVYEVEGTNRQSTFASEVNLVEVADSVLALYRGRLEQASIQVAKSFPASALITGHEGEIRQVLANLVGNAIDASRLGGSLRLRIRHRRSLQDGKPGLCLTLADSGCGMSKTVGPRIFEPFFTTKGITGSGLGLWISLDLVKNHGGRIAIRSSEEFRHHGTIISCSFLSVGRLKALALPLKQPDTFAPAPQ